MPGDYVISSTIVLDTANTTCFLGKSRSTVTIAITTGADTDDGFPLVGAFYLDGNAVVKLERLVLDGLNSSPGITSYDCTLAIEDVTVRNCLSASDQSAGVTLWYTWASFKRTSLIDNDARGRGGALFVSNGSTAWLNQVGQDVTIDHRVVHLCTLPTVATSTLSH